MRRLLGTTLLVLALGVSTYAGEIPFGVTNPPPPPATAPDTADEPEGGEIPFGGQAATQVLVNLLGGVLALF